MLWVYKTLFWINAALAGINLVLFFVAYHWYSLLAAVACTGTAWLMRKCQQAYRG